MDCDDNGINLNSNQVGSGIMSNDHKVWWGYEWDQNGGVEWLERRESIGKKRVKKTRKQLKRKENKWRISQVLLRNKRVIEEL